MTTYQVWHPDITGDKPDEGYTHESSCPEYAAQDCQEGYDSDDGPNFDDSTEWNVTDPDGKTVVVIVSAEPDVHYYSHVKKPEDARD